MSSNQSNKRKRKPLIIRRIFTRPKSFEDLVKKTLLFILYFWPAIYFTVTGTWTEPF